MKKILLIISVLCIALGAQAKRPAYKFYPKTDLRPDKTVFLYVPDGKKELKKALKNLTDPVHAKMAETLALDRAEDNGFTQAENMFDPNGATLYINDYARFDLYFPKKEANGCLVVVLPGGGYNCVCHYIEGVYAADWLVERGYTVAVVKYRLPAGHPAIPLTDVHHAMRYCRNHQQEWGISRIGVMGFSAGGHLAASASVLYDDAATRPDFSVLYYPVISLVRPFGHTETGERLIGNYEQRRAEDAAALEKDLAKYELQNQVTADTPPTFIVLSSDDREVNPLNSLVYYEALAAHKVPAELHVFHHGIHGFGFDYYKFNPNDWLFEARDNLFEIISRWLEKQR